MDEQTLTFLLEQARFWGIRIVGVLVALFVAWIIAGWLSNTLRKALERRSFDATLTRFFAKMVRYTVLTFAVIGCLGVFGIETASFAAIIAAAGLAVGLAFQGTLSNFAAGVMLLIFRPFKVGDFVRAAGETGTVEEIELFTTEMKTPDNRRIIVPNSAIFSGNIENVTHYPERRCDIDVGIAYSADCDTVRALFEKLVPTIEGVLAEPAPQVFLKGLGGSSVDWVLRVWCKTPDYWTVHQRTIAEAKKALDEAGISIPFPQMDLHLDEEVLSAMGGKRA